MEYTLEMTKHYKEEIFRLLHETYNDYQNIDNSTGKELLSYFTLNDSSVTPLTLFSRFCKDFMLHAKEMEVDAFSEKLEKEIIQLFGPSVFFGPHETKAINEISEHVNKLLHNNPKGKHAGVFHEIATNKKWLKLVRKDAKNIVLHIIGRSYLSFFKKNFPGERAKLKNNIALDIPRKKRSKKEYVFEEIFVKTEKANSFIELLKKLDPPVINSKDHFIGDHKGIFAFLVEVLLDKGEIKKIPKVRYNEAFNKKFHNLDLTIDASEFGGTYKRLNKKEILREVEKYFPNPPK